MSCDNCDKKPILIRSFSKSKLCKECFLSGVENDVHNYIVQSRLFDGFKKIGVGVSGGKDSTVLIYILDKLNKKFKYNVEIEMVCIDEGISGYRDQSIKTVLENSRDLGLPLKIVGYKELFGITMDEVVGKIGRKGNCMYCGVFRRNALNKACEMVNADCIVTGHNADDMAETIILNIIRGDISRLRRCTQERTTGESSLPRCKPFKFISQKEIVLYGHFRSLKYFSTECTYAPGSSRGDVRDLIKSLEKIDSSTVIKIIKVGEKFNDSNRTAIHPGNCKECGTVSSLEICMCCQMLKRLK